MSSIPLPPEALVRRVGWDLHNRDPAEAYEERGREQWRLIKSLLPAGWTFAGKRVLDFGRGALPPPATAAWSRGSLARPVEDR